MYNESPSKPSTKTEKKERDYLQQRRRTPCPRPDKRLHTPWTRHEHVDTLLSLRSSRSSKTGCAYPSRLQELLPADLPA